MSEEEEGEEVRVGVGGDEGVGCACCCCCCFFCSSSSSFLFLSSSSRFFCSSACLFTAGGVDTGPGAERGDVGMAEEEEEGEEAEGDEVRAGDGAAAVTGEVAG